MNNKNRRRLPLRAVEVFETAARAGGVNAAARLLGITPPAVSRHLRNLEERLGVVLFEHGARPARPTAAARELLPSISNALDQIDGACRDLGERNGGKLTVSCLSSAAAWLAPQAARFQRENPDILLALHCGDEMADFHRDRADVALRYGDGEYPGVHAEKMMDEAVAPLCSPEFLKRHPAREVGDLCDMELIDNVRPPDDASAKSAFAREEWRGWLAAMGVPREPEKIGFATTQADHAMRLALAGDGLVLGRGLLAVEHLKIGNLAAPLQFSTWTGRAYYFVCPMSARERPPVRRFAEWLRNVFAARKKEAEAHFPPPREFPPTGGGGALI